MEVNNLTPELILKTQQPNKIVTKPKTVKSDDSKDKTKLVLGTLGAMAVLGAAVVLTRRHLLKNGNIDVPKLNETPRPSQLPNSSNILRSAGAQIKEFRESHVIPAEQKIVDGFMDGGRKAILNENNEIIKASREVIVVNRAEDKVLSEFINQVKKQTEGMTEEDKVEFLYKYVSKLAGDSTVAEKNVQIYSFANGQKILLGEIFNKPYPLAVCRHRSLLFKVLGDELGLSVQLQRGKMGVVFEGEFIGGGHAWNVVKFKNGKSLLVDTMNAKKLDLSAKEAQRQYFSVNKEPLYK